LIKAMNITIKADSEDIRIYVDKLLHLRFPRDKNIIVHSWIEGHSKAFYISLDVNGRKEVVIYASKEMWEKVLKVLDCEL
jgi:hypothetical protein